MRAAICYCSQLRTGLKCLENQRLFFGNVRADFFVHTWSTNTNRRFATTNRDVTVIPPAILDAYIAEIKPTMFLVEDAINLSLSKTPDSVSAQYYSWMKSIMMKRQWERVSNTKYDVVVKLRPDIIFNPERRLKPILDKAIETGKFLIENESMEYNGGIDDVFWVAANDVMDAVVNMVERQLIENPGFGKIAPHTNLGQFLLSHGIKIGSTRVSNADSVYSYAIYRKEFEHLSPITQFEECFLEERNYFSDITTPPADQSSDYYQ